MQFVNLPQPYSLVAPNQITVQTKPGATAQLDIKYSITYSDGKFAPQHFQQAADNSGMTTFVVPPPSSCYGVFEPSVDLVATAPDSNGQQVQITAFLPTGTCQ